MAVRVCGNTSGSVWQWKRLCAAVQQCGCDSARRNVRQCAAVRVRQCAAVQAAVCGSARGSSVRHCSSVRKCGSLRQGTRQCVTMQHSSVRQCERQWCVCGGSSDSVRQCGRWCDSAHESVRQCAAVWHCAAVR